LGGAGVVVVDARRFDEYAIMSIPTATSVPGAELALRVRALAPDPATTVIVNCAGRTRSIIGTQSLINAGLPNRVAALRNGTIGWTLAGLDLDHGQARRAPEVAPDTAREAAAAAWSVADRAGVRRVDVSRVGDDEPGWPDDGGRTVYRFDVRTPEEYERGHRRGFRSAPGGQLVQETDWYAPVRGAVIILDDDGAGRAAMTGSWLAQMGWDVALAGPGKTGSTHVTATEPGRTGPTHVTAAEPGRTGPSHVTATEPGRTGSGDVTATEPGRTGSGDVTVGGRRPAPGVALASPAEVAEWLRTGQAAVVDIDTSRRYLAGHVPGAAWALRADLTGPELLDRLGRPGRLVLASADGYLAAWAAADLGAELNAGRSDGSSADLNDGLRAGRGTRVVVLAGGTEGWARSGRPLASGPGELLSAALDVYRRPYEGTGVDPAVMQAYLEWEYGLVGQLRRDGTHGFRVLTS
jgi:rhodanese-related sulfurtransferase